MPKIDSDILCTATGEICPAKQELATLFTANRDSVDYEVGARDEALYQGRMAEYRIVGAAACSGVTERRTCNLRDQMNESKIRKGLVGTVRSLFGKPQPAATLDKQS